MHILLRHLQYSYTGKEMTDMGGWEQDAKIHNDSVSRAHTHTHSLTRKKIHAFARQTSRAHWPCPSKFSSARTRGDISTPALLSYVAPPGGPGFAKERCRRNARRAEEGRDRFAGEGGPAPLEAEEGRSCCLRSPPSLLKLATRLKIFMADSDRGGSGGGGASPNATSPP